MICLDNADTLEGGASVNAVVDYTVHGLVGTTFTNIAQGQLSDTDPTVLYTAGAAISIVSVVFVNTHSAAVTVNLYLDPANAGTPRRLIPKTLSLGIGYMMIWDGARFSVFDASGKFQTSTSGGGDVTAAANLTDNALVRGDGGAKGVQTSTALVSDAGEMTNPSQPAFLAIASATLSNVTGDGTNYTIVFGTEVFDQGGVFNGVSLFTAPVAGRYSFSTILGVQGLAAANVINIRLVTSNRYYPLVCGFTYTNTGATLTVSDVDMDAADTAYITFAVTGGTKIVDLAGDGTNAWTSFSGHLVC